MSFYIAAPDDNNLKFQPKTKNHAIAERSPLQLTYFDPDPFAYFFRRIEKE
jgi:hypothetical protein